MLTHVADDRCSWFPPEGSHQPTDCTWPVNPRSFQWRNPACNWKRSPTVEVQTWGICSTIRRRNFGERGLNRGHVQCLWNIRRSEKISTKEARVRCLGLWQKEYSVISELPSSKETSLWLSGYNGQKGTFSLFSIITFGVVCWNKDSVVAFDSVKSYGRGGAEV